MKMKKLIRSSGDGFKVEGLEELLRQARRRVDSALKHVRRPEAAVGVIKSPLGDLLVAMTARGIVLNHYLVNDSDLAATLEKARLQLDLVEDCRAVKEIGEEIRRYLAGEGKALRQNIDLSLAASPFQQKVLRKLQEIPRGAVVSYQALGAAAGAPKGARAVGNAMHNNPVPIYVPCHRVIASDGGLGGYGGGAGRKLQLLRSEGFALGDRDVKLPGSSVWGHKTTKIYCRTDCRTAARVDRSRILFFADPKDARHAGLRPCKICRPE
ncbi:MAG: methylated-DNA--[protein]-cysteine S-methyltransferase [Candidatus Binatia bacterium]